ncbi:MAG: C40 family peptidase [Lysobacter sp.]|nr:C40 family peptidase [Lysobacter sp.]
MTTLHSGLGHTANPLPAPSGALRFLCAAALFAASLPVLADQKSAVDTTATNAAVLAQLTPGLAEASPLLDRGAMMGGDLSAFAMALPQNAAAEPKGGKIQTVLKRALALLGTPYRWGGTSPDGGFDCSGLVGYVFRTALGIELPRVSRDMADNGQLISDRAALNEGDLVFFGRRGHVDHVGIYVGQGNFVHAPRTGRDVTVSSLTTGYWSGKFMQARRVAM